MVKCDVAGESLSLFMRNLIEIEKKIPITPRYKLNIKVPEENKKIIEINDVKLHPSLHDYHIMEIAKDIKESICKIINDPKQEK